MTTIQVGIPNIWADLQRRAIQDAVSASTQNTKGVVQTVSLDGWSRSTGAGPSYKVDELLLSSGEADGSATGPNLRPAAPAGSVALAYIMAKFQKDVADVTDQQLSDHLKLFKEQNEGARKAQKELSEEVAKREEAAAKTSEVSNCAGKILGGVVAAVGIVGAAFTGGASLALAGIGLGIMAADAITEAVTGKSLTDRLITPLITAVFSPLVKAIGGLIADVLTKVGVDKDIADMIGTAVGTVLAMAVVVVAAVVTKSSAVGKLATKLAEPMMKAMGKAVPKLIQQAASQVGKLASKAGGKVAAGANKLSSGMQRGATRMGTKMGVKVNPQVFALRAQQGAVGMSMVNGGAQAGVGTWLGVNERDMQNAMAEITEALSNTMQMGRFVDTATDTWKRLHTNMSASQEAVTNVIAADQAASAFILRNAARVAT